MRKSVILLLLAVMTLTTGCDFFRALAGRPTDKDIQDKRVEIMKAEEAMLQARLDSIAQEEERVSLEAEKALQDSLDACAYIADNGIILLNASKVRGIAEDGLYDKTSGVRYRIILGSFRDRENAVSLQSRISEEGDFRAHLVRLGNGMIAVAACPSDRIDYAVRGYKELKSNPICPSDAWILKCE